MSDRTSDQTSTVHDIRMWLYCKSGQEKGTLSADDWLKEVVSNSWRLNNIYTICINKKEKYIIYMTIYTYKLKLIVHLLSNWFTIKRNLICDSQHMLSKANSSRKGLDRILASIFSFCLYTRNSILEYSFFNAFSRMNRWHSISQQLKRALIENGVILPMSIGGVSVQLTLLSVIGENKGRYVLHGLLAWRYVVTWKMKASNNWGVNFFQDYIRRRPEK